MLASKKDRQAKLLELVEKNVINTQEELLSMLIDSGVQATQATVSRDIRALRITKTPLPNGGYRYICPKLKDTSIQSKLRSIFSESISSVDFAGNIVVIHCEAGMANAVCAAIDAEEWDDLLGTVAGDDTIFMLLRTPDRAAELVATLSHFIY